MSDQWSLHFQMTLHSQIEFVSLPVELKEVNCHQSQAFDIWGGQTYYFQQKMLLPYEGHLSAPFQSNSKYAMDTNV